MIGLVIERSGEAVGRRDRGAELAQRLNAEPQCLGVTVAIGQAV